MWLLRHNLLHLSTALFFIIRNVNNYTVVHADTTTSSTAGYYSSSSSSSSWSSSGVSYYNNGASTSVIPAITVEWNSASPTYPPSKRKTSYPSQTPVATKKPVTTTRKPSTSRPITTETPTTSPVTNAPTTTSPSARPTACTLSLAERKSELSRIASNVTNQTNDSSSHHAITWILYNDSFQLPCDKTQKLIQRYILAHIYFTLDGNNWKRCRAIANSSPSNTNDTCLKETQRFLSNEDECKWHGIQCNRDGFVTKVTLVDNNLSGMIPEEIVHLVNLTEIQLSHNRIHGLFPKFIASLPKLQILDLQSNQFNGTISDMIASPSIEELSLEENHWIGSIPNSICTLRSSKLLTHLSADCNPFVTNTSIVVDAPVQCSCCTKCSPDTSSVSHSYTEQVSSESCFNGTSIAYANETQTPSTMVLHVLYKVESLNYLDRTSAVDVSLENALVHHVAQDVLSCFWIGDAKGQPVEISSNPPDSFADTTCVAGASAHNCYVINGFLSVYSFPGETLNWLQTNAAIQNSLSNNPFTVSLTLASGENITVTISYFSPNAERFYGSNPVIRGDDNRIQTSSFLYNVFLPVSVGASLMGLLFLFAIIIHRRVVLLSSRKKSEENIYCEEQNNNINNNVLFNNHKMGIMSPEIEFVEGDIATISDIDFSQGGSFKGNINSTAWDSSFISNENECVRRSTFLDLEGHPSRPFSMEPDEINYPFQVQYPFCRSTNDINIQDFTSIDSSQIEDDWKTASDMNSEFSGEHVII